MELGDVSETSLGKVDLESSLGCERHHNERREVGLELPCTCCEGGCS